MRARAAARGGAAARPDPPSGGAGNTTRGEGVRRGVGFALQEHRVLEGFDDSTAARVRIDADGRAEIHCAAAEVGQGVSDVILQVAREELGTWTTWCSPRDRLGAVGRLVLGFPAHLDGVGAVRDACRAALADRAAQAAGEVDVERVPAPADVALDPETGQTTGVRSHVAFAVSAMKVVAEVDEELGLTRIVWIGTAQDVGRAVNPLAVQGQIEGGTQGIGLALMEEIQLVDGTVRNASFTDYLIPTSLDVPPVVEAVLIEEAEPDAPYGVKGVGEPPTVVSTAAVVAAMRAATGRALTRVPVRPDDIAL